MLASQVNLLIVGCRFVLPRPVPNRYLKFCANRIQACLLLRTPSFIALVLALQSEPRLNRAARPGASATIRNRAMRSCRLPQSALAICTRGATPETSSGTSVQTATSYVMHLPMPPDHAFPIYLQLTDNTGWNYLQFSRMAHRRR